jgi:hypothetical protein
LMYFVPTERGRMMLYYFIFSFMLACWKGDCAIIADNSLIL